MRRRRSPEEEDDERQQQTGGREEEDLEEEVTPRGRPAPSLTLPRSAGPSTTPRRHVGHHPETNRAFMLLLPSVTIPSSVTDRPHAFDGLLLPHVGHHPVVGDEDLRCAFQRMLLPHLGHHPVVGDGDGGEQPSASSPP